MLHVHSIRNILNIGSPVQEVNASGEISNFSMSCVKQLDTGQVMYTLLNQPEKKEGEKTKEREGDFS